METAPEGPPLLRARFYGSPSRAFAESHRSKRRRRLPCSALPVARKMIQKAALVFPAARHWPRTPHLRTLLSKPQEAPLRARPPRLLLTFLAMPASLVLAIVSWRSFLIPCS